MNKRFQINDRIGDYRVLGFIGQGGMGEVYHAVHEKLNRSVAVKVLGGSIGFDREYKTRFLNEARLQASLHHPNIATLYDFQEFGNELLIFMEFINGDSLDSLIEAKYFSIEESLKVFESIVEAISYIHQHGIIHRDIKTDNVKLTADGVPKLLDFGIAKDSSSQNLTQVGGVIGTPNYLAPEQLEGRMATEQTDVWALGVLLYKMLTGKVPFESDYFDTLLSQIRIGKFEAPETLNSAIPKVVADIVRKCLARDLSQRYQTAQELLRDVRQVLKRRYGTETYLSKMQTDGSFPVAKVGAAAAGLILFFVILATIGIWAISDPAGTVEVKTPVKTADNQNQNVSTERKDTPIAQTERKNESANKRTVRIDAVGGSAEVWRNGQKIGNTPLDLEIGEKEIVALKLKRQGSTDTDVSVEATVGKKVYTYSLASK
ncbi:MAG TPA: serine/threonine-protein kinase [Pyrinomonadaceae bacterium]|nr:serine/threonine-protein kinase [Pyrinomonadaceae bacterium]